MRTCLNTLFFILLLTTSTLCSQENILELIDQSPEGRDILNAIYLEVKIASPELNRGAVYQILQNTKRNAQRNEVEHKANLARHASSCKNDTAVLHGNMIENQRHDMTISRHLNSNNHAIGRNGKYISRALAEFNQYESLRNLITVNRERFSTFTKTSIEKSKKINELMTNAKKLLIAASKQAAGHAFIQLPSNLISGFTEIRVEFANISDNMNGLRPIISSLLQVMADPSNVGKDAIRAHLVKMLHDVKKSISQRIDELEQRLDGADAVFEALLKNIAENKTRVQKLQERLDSERVSLEKRKSVLVDARTRSANITNLSKSAIEIRHQQCANMREDSTRRVVSNQKLKNIVAQIEEILQERFGQLKGFFIERKMRLNKH